MSARIYDFAAEKQRRRDAVLPYVAMALVCFWPAFLIVAAGLGVADAIAAHRDGVR